MFERGAGGFSVVFENEDVAKTLVIFQIEHAVAIRPQHILNGALRKSRESSRVVRSLDDDFVGADAIHLVKQAFPVAIQVPFDAKRREFVGNHTYAPAGGVHAAAAAAIDQNFRWSFCFASGTEGTILTIRSNNAFTQEFIGALATFCRDNDPATRD